jgi:hypothetical protein
MHTTFFIRLFTEALQEDYKDQTEATISATYRDEGGDHEQNPVLVITPTHII